MLSSLLMGRRGSFLFSIPPVSSKKKRKTMTRLIVISGPANTGKMPLARELQRIDQNLCIVHRDDIRAMLNAPCDEWNITLMMGDITGRLLAAKKPAIVCAWNLEKEDMLLWMETAHKYSVPLVWLDVRASEVKAMIPPTEEEKNA